MSASRRGTAGPKDVVRAGVPLLLLAGAIALPSVAGVCLLVLVGGVAVAAGRRVPVAWAWAAMVPGAAIATLRAFGPAAAAWDQPACSDVASAPVLWAVVEVVLVVAAVAALAAVLRAKASDLGLRRPPRYAVRWATVGALAILVTGLAGAFLLAGPVLGLRGVDPGGLGFAVPALIFAVSLAVSEELAWRGAMQGWLTKTLGPSIAVLLQAVAYGAAWGFLLGSLLAGLLAAAVGLMLGATVVRSRTLTVALAWHVAFNVPLYLVVACRAA